MGRERAAPSPEEVVDEGCFCAGVPNLLLRFVGREIPTLGDELYDGGCLAYGEYYYSVSEAFDINEEYPEGTLIGRYFSWERLANNDQGHVAVVLSNGYLLQSYDGDGTGLSGYRIGKALSFTHWQIQSVEEHWNQVDGDRSFADPWNEAFDKQRIDEIQRHVNALSTVLDPRSVTAVTTGLDYWRSALLYLTPLEGSSKAWSWSWWRNALRRVASIGESSSVPPQSPQPPSYKERTIKIPIENRQELLKALEEQIDNWLDVLTERRPPESFPVAGIVASLTKKVVADTWARVLRVLVPIVFTVLIIGGLVVAGVLVFGNLSDVVAKVPAVLGSLGTVLVAIFGALFAPRGQSSFGQGGATGARGGIGGGPRGGGGWGGSRGAGAALANVAVSLKEDVFSSVVEQLRLEEINLAISDPLIRCVLSLKGQETGDPQKDAERFLHLVLKDQPNLKRLQPVFKDLYKY